MCLYSFKKAGKISQKNNLVVRWAHIPEVGGSNPSCDIKRFIIRIEININVGGKLEKNEVIKKIEEFSLEDEQKKFKLIEQISNITQQIWEISAEEKYERPEHLTGNTEYSIWNQPVEWLELELAKLNERQKEKKEVEKSTKGMYLIKELWDAAFGKDIFEQPAYSDFYFHLFIGTVFFHDFKIGRWLDDIGYEVCEEDIRAHMVLIGPTGVGKSQSNDFIADIMSEIPKKIYTDAEGNEQVEYFVVSGVGKTTDAGYVGTLDGDIYNRNAQKNINQYRVGEDGRRELDPRWQDPMQPGLFKMTDLMIVDEAETIFRANKDSSEIQVTLRKVMNRYGSSGNILSNDAAKCHGIVKYPAATSVGMTSFPVKEFNTEFADGGLMQRTFVFIDYEDWEKRQRILKKFTASMVNSFPDDEFAERKRKHEELLKKYGGTQGVRQTLIDRVTDLKRKTCCYTDDWKPENRKEYIINKEVAEMIEENSIKLVTSPMTMSQQEKQQSQSTRIALLFMRVAGHYSIIDGNFDEKGRPVLRIEDVEKAYQSIMMYQSDSVADFLKETMKENDGDKIFLRRCNEVKNFLRAVQDDVTKTQLEKGMKRKWNISMSKAKSILKQIEQRDVYSLESAGKGNTKHCVLKGKKPEGWIKNK